MMMATARFDFSTTTAALASHADAAVRSIGYAYSPGVAGRGRYLDLSDAASARQKAAGAVLLAKDGSFAAVPLDGVTVRAQQLKVATAYEAAGYVTSDDFYATYKSIWPSVLTSGAAGVRQERQRQS
jgi:hypothetical protein